MRGIIKSPMASARIELHKAQSELEGYVKKISQHYSEVEENPISKLPIPSRLEDEWKKVALNMIKQISKESENLKVYFELMANDVEFYFPEFRYKSIDDFKGLKAALDEHAPSIKKELLEAEGAVNGITKEVQRLSNIIDDVNPTDFEAVCSAKNELDKFIKISDDALNKVIAVSEKCKKEGIDWDKFRSIASAEESMYHKIKEENLRPNFTIREPVREDNVLHLLLTNLALALSSQEKHDQKWLDKLDNYINMVTLILQVCPTGERTTLVKSKNKHGKTPLQAMALFCPSFTSVRENVSLLLRRVANIAADIDEKDRDSLDEINKKLGIT